MIQAIFLDFNGVIINDERLQLAAYREVLVPYGIDLTEADYFSCLGMDDRTFVVTAFHRAGKAITEDNTRAIMQAKVTSHRKLIEDDLPLCNGVVTFLKATARHYSLGVVSMSGRDDIDYVLRRARLESVFSVIVSAADVDACKPEPDCYLGALKKLNETRRQTRLLPVLTSECLVIEDSPPGIQAGRAAGMRTLGVTNTVPEVSLRDAGAEVVTASLADWTVDSLRHVFD
jgi:HAD superfamily hydrolase (TIGR01509 family)